MKLKLNTSAVLLMLGILIVFSVSIVHYTTKNEIMKREPSALSQPLKGILQTRGLETPTTTLTIGPRKVLTATSRSTIESNLKAIAREAKTIYHGLAGSLAFVQGFEEPTPELKAKLNEIIDSGDLQVMALVPQEKADQKLIGLTDLKMKAKEQDQDPSLSIAKAEGPLEIVSRGNYSLRDRVLAEKIETIEQQKEQERFLEKSQSESFLWPCNGDLITSEFGPRWGTVHTGIDIDQNPGEPIYASKSGTVVEADYVGGYGNHVIIDHGQGVSTLYAHLSAYNVEPGQRINQGDVIGEAGCSGWATGTHLHFEIRFDGEAKNPLDYVRKP